MNNQEAFNRVVTHLRKQGRKSLRGGGCAYRSQEGDRCAAGVLLTDEFYHPFIEGAGLYSTVERIQALAVTDRVRAKLLCVRDIFARALPDVSLKLIQELQLIHDHSHPDLWEYRWSALARQFSLIFPPIEAPVLTTGAPEERSCVDSPSAQERETVLV